MPLVDAYIARLRDLAILSDYREQFYLCLHDQQLYDMEQELLESGEASELLPALIALYSAWRVEMGEGRWADLLAYDDELTDGNKNWLITELDAPEGKGGDTSHVVG